MLLTTSKGALLGCIVEICPAQVVRLAGTKKTNKTSKTNTGSTQDDLVASLPDAQA